MSAWRAGRILAGFFALTVPLMPVQALLVRVAPKWARTFPNWYHRRVCALIGVRVRLEGEIPAHRPVLLVANHTSWLDIPVLSAVAPVSFVAKREVGRWPFVSSLARLQRTVFVDRERRSAAAASANEIAERLAAGDKLVLFAEGTSSDGNRVLPFKSSLFAAAKPGRSHSAEQSSLDDTPAVSATGPVVQTLTVCYTHLHGVPLERADRPLVGWYGDMEMGSHAWTLLKAGPLDVTVSVGPPVALDRFRDRKDLARHTEEEIRHELVRLLRGRGKGERIALSQPERTASPVPKAKRSEKAKNWV